MIALRLSSPDDVAEIVECLLIGADQVEGHAPELAAVRRHLAHALGDGLDALPQSSPALAG